MILDVDRHMRALRTSSMLTESHRRMYQPAATMVRPEKVIRVLREAGIRFVVMGTHGMTGYRKEARATQDVDILVRPADHAKAIVALEKAYRKLKVTNLPVVTRFIDPVTEEPVIDLMKPYTHYLKMVFRNCVPVGDSHLIPTLEMALATKFAAMTSPNRSHRKKHTDAGDFMTIVEKNAGAINLNKLKKLGEAVYPGGGTEIVQYVEDTKADRGLQI